MGDIMRRAEMLAACLFLVCVPLAGCSHTPQRAAAMKSNVYPTGIVAFTSPAVALQNGVYAADSQQYCCFLSGYARFQVYKRSIDRKIRLALYVPGYQPLKRGERVEARVNAGKVSVYLLKPGFRVVTLVVPPSRPASVVANVRLRMGITFVPANLGINPGTGDLSVILISAKSTR